MHLSVRGYVLCVVAGGCCDWTSSSATSLSSFSLSLFYLPCSSSGPAPPWRWHNQTGFPPRERERRRVSKRRIQYFYTDTLKYCCNLTRFYFSYYFSYYYYNPCHCSRGPASGATVAASAAKTFTTLLSKAPPLPLLGLSSCLPHPPASKSNQMF